MHGHFGRVINRQAGGELVHALVEDGDVSTGELVASQQLSRAPVGPVEGVLEHVDEHRVTHSFQNHSVKLTLKNYIPCPPNYYMNLLFLSVGIKC
jgi:hypothetical protein